MKEWKDKHWDAKYEQFRLEKQRRRDEANGQPEAQKAKSKIDLNRSGYNSYRNKIKPVKEERIFVNKGPSRFLKTHSDDHQSHTYRPQQQQSMTGNIQIINEEPQQAQTLVVEAHETNARFDFKKLLPYLFIIFGIVIVYLLVTNKL